MGEWLKPHASKACIRGTVSGVRIPLSPPCFLPHGFQCRDSCTVAQWNEQSEIVEENLFYDLMGMLKQIGVLPGEERHKVA